MDDLMGETPSHCTHHAAAATAATVATTATPGLAPGNSLLTMTIGTAGLPQPLTEQGEEILPWVQDHMIHVITHSVHQVPSPHLQVAAALRSSISTKT